MKAGKYKYIYHVEFDIELTNEVNISQSELKKMVNHCFVSKSVIIDSILMTPKKVVDSKLVNKKIKPKSVYEFMELTKDMVTIGKRYNIENEYRYVANGDYYSLCGYVDDAPLCQYTTCRHCNTKLVSWGKDAQCPICGKRVYLT